MPEQDLDDPDIGSVLQKVRREAVAQRVQRDPLGQTCSFDCRPAGGMQHGWINRMILITTGEEIVPRPGEPPIGAQDGEQLRGQHHVAVLRPLPVAHLYHASRTVNVFDPKARDLRGPEPCRIGGCECCAALQARHGFEKLHDLVGAQNNRQFVGFPRIGNAFRDERLAERNAVEETQGAYDLIEPRPRNAGRHQVNLESADVFQFQLVR
jgi:hypothetical protein